MWKCPECGSLRLRVQVVTHADLFQDGDDIGSETVGDQEWGDESPMLCLDCSHGGPAKDFEVEGTA